MVSWSVLILKRALTWSWWIPICWHHKSTNNDRHILQAWLDKDYRSPGMYKQESSKWHIHATSVPLLRPLSLQNTRFLPKIWKKIVWLFSMTSTQIFLMMFSILRNVLSGTWNDNRNIFWDENQDQFLFQDNQYFF